ncbi:MAG: hypothetical protein KFF68_00710, partial [Desulfosarcina sp.]|nr:hypothetical protein [Desulfosarcina sp.]
MQYLKKNDPQVSALIEKEEIRIEETLDLISGGTDNHQIIVDLTANGLKGAAAEKALESVGIVLNRNVIPSDARTPGSVSGLR